MWVGGGVDGVCFVICVCVCVCVCVCWGGGGDSIKSLEEMPDVQITDTLNAFTFSFFFLSFFFGYIF